ncbi:hypothetical protein Ct61P_00526 [Colletotrichum tofieldiae]|nr:hypothetical protein Ct61P_00526 [Colletotrichum tofieldiae]
MRQGAPDYRPFSQHARPGQFTVERAGNRGCATLSRGGRTATQWPDCSEHPEDWRAPAPGKCLVDNPGKRGGEVHTQNYTATAGTAFATSHQSDIRKVAMENLAVFSAVEQWVGPSDVEVDVCYWREWTVVPRGNA